MTSLFWFNFPSKMSSETQPPINGLDEASPVLHVDAGENEEGDEEGVPEEPQTTGQCHDQQFMVCYIINCSGDGRKKKKKKTEQGDPPRIGLSKFYPDGIYPEGEIQLYKDECVGRPVIFLTGLQDTNLSETAIPGASRQKKNDTMNA